MNHDEILNSDEILNRIKQRGYYQILQRPSSKSNNFSWQKLEDMIKINQVRNRGWFYPHTGNNQFSKFRKTDNFIESHTLWGPHIQIWRFYQSGQFKIYLGLPEDRWDDYPPVGLPWDISMESKIPGTKFLEAIMTIYQMTEIWLFALRLSKFLNVDCTIDNSLHNMSNRTLVLRDPNKFPLVGDYVCHDDTITLTSTEMSPKYLELHHDDLAVQQTLKIFEYFNWSGSHIMSLLKDSQKKFYSRSF